MQIDEKRRNFIKKAGITGAMLSTAPQLLAKENQTKKIASASNVGAFYADVDESGKIVKITHKLPIKTQKYLGVRLG